MNHKIILAQHQRPYHAASIPNDQTEDYEFIFRILKLTIQKLFNIAYNPNILVTDGAAPSTNSFQNVFRPEYFFRIMCWFQMLINFEKQLLYSLKEYKEQIMSLE
jgi:hypothetical protein